MIEDRLPPIHPSEVLREDIMAELALETDAAARALEVPESDLASFLAGHRSVTADLAIRLERVFGASARFWLNLQASYDLAVTRDRAQPDAYDRLRRLPAPENALVAG